MDDLLGRVTKKEELELLNNPDNWPYYPLIPLVNIHAQSTKNGFLVADLGPVLYLANIFDLKAGRIEPQLKDIETLRFNSFDALLDAGWEID